MSQCPLCEYREQQMLRALAEVLDLRLQVADGPRSRVRELEAIVERQNETIRSLNARIPRNRKRAS